MTTKKINLAKTTDAQTSQLTENVVPRFEILNYTANTGRELFALLGDTKQYSDKLLALKRNLGGIWYCGHITGTLLNNPQYKGETKKGWLFETDRQDTIAEVNKFIADPEGYRPPTKKQSVAKKKAAKKENEIEKRAKELFEQWKLSK